MKQPPLNHLSRLCAVSNKFCVHSKSDLFVLEAIQFDGMHLHKVQKMIR